VIACSFKDESGGGYRVLNLFAKRARGLMADFIIRKRVASPEHLKDFNAEGYRFDPKSSAPDRIVFLRTEKARKSVVRGKSTARLSA
jgi:uncharacterized protein